MIFSSAARISRAVRLFMHRHSMPRSKNACSISLWGRNGKKGPRRRPISSWRGQVKNLSFGAICAHLNERPFTRSWGVLMRVMTRWDFHFQKREFKTVSFRAFCPMIFLHFQLLHKTDYRGNLSWISRQSLRLSPEFFILFSTDNLHLHTNRHIFDTFF